MIKIELTKDTETFPSGTVLLVDENSAKVLVERGDAKLIADAEPEVVESGGERARAINAAAKAEAEAEAETESEDPPKSESPSTAKGSK
ncbi:hypothetical protein [Mycobacteroides abscessus]|uniref:hypothetical protein n=1 Tax=Mycobacteroides abscessus TaxID=36809 RepID=UPI0005E4ABDE|nr:hypothetical protein [Mycobacteroides abscessus]CPR79212.1 Uncharacterised protein [Mycobacteroides abscessus]CPR88364.1 Uncharacterised protein [Mycobacteroides abscessus]CPS43302.1 Uncharacterised protein [Mycobacteroides abscessus]CPV03105.1 Uncharacterised protein [Mycobacteroides abscessus]